jgi:hypothetical protein
MVNMLSFGGAREKCVRKLAEGEGAMGKVHAFAMDDGLGSDEQFGSEDVVDDQANVVSDGAGDESQRGRSGSPCSQSQSSSASPVPELSNQNSIGEYDEEEAQEDAVSDKELESNSIDVQSVVDAFIAYEVRASPVPCMRVGSNQSAYHSLWAVWNIFIRV